MSVNWFKLVTIIISATIMAAPLVVLYEVCIRI